jgi:hypothetical protein
MSLLKHAQDMHEALKKSQNILAEWIVPDSKITDEQCLNKLLEILDDESLILTMDESSLKFIDLNEPRTKEVETVNRKHFCPACNAIKHGIKSRRAFEHTCGL